MKTSKDDPEAEGRRLLAPLADKLARTDTEDRRRLVTQLMPNATPTILRLLVELLVRRLEYRNPKVRDGAEEALVLLGTRVLPTLESAVLNKPSEALLLRLAPLCASLGQRLPEQDRTRLQMTLIIAANRAPTQDSCAVLWVAVGCLQETPTEEESFTTWIVPTRPVSEEQELSPHIHDPSHFAASQAVLSLATGQSDQLILPEGVAQASAVE